MLNKRIKALRLSKDLTQKELSDKLGLTPKMISFYELGDRVPPPDVLEKLADIFGVSTDYLLCRTRYVACPICHILYNPLDKNESDQHAKSHSKFTILQKKLGFLYSPSQSNTKRVISEGFLKDGNLPDEGQASHVETLLKADYSDYARNKKYDVDMSYKDFCSKKILEGSYLDLISENAKKILFETYGITQNALTKRDERDIKKDLDSLMEKLAAKECGPAAYNGEDLSPEAAELFRDELGIALKRLKLINKEKYNPHKNKK